MTFEGQYLTYQDYLVLGGATMENMPFNLLEFEARRRIDIQTQDRLKNTNYVDIPQEVKICVYNLINNIKQFAESNTELTGNGNVASEHTDGYSINYITADKISEVVKSKNDELEDIIRTYLLGVIFNGEHLMYIGV